ncbi:odorant receptor 4 isoform X2 [Cephus cinctus]|uniref:Odorant receptor n=1 Tax=Cephus cinctus TaxID=211228 RepID=A0AAJ7FTI8_CEPCN|nr:odorant receptor 4 isoform X2 [Cephus cinctus]XP_024946762.1 odorant receptor 4 isoform X2 [Cephus cinctus]
MDISEAEKVLTWNKWLLDFLGIWPTNKNNTKFYFFFTFITVQCCLQYADLIEYIDDFEYVLVNLTESIVFTMILLKIVQYKINTGRLIELIRDIRTDYSKELYRTEEEMAIFIRYNSFSKIILYCLSISGVITSSLYYIRPLSSYLLAHNDPTGNSSSSFILPYHVRLFFDLTEVPTYYAIYACEIWVIPMVVCGFMGTDCLLITLVLHVCGQFSILTIQVENLTHDPRELHDELKRIVIKHRRLIRLFANLHSAYSTFLLQELVGITLLTCLGSYNVIVTPILKETTYFLIFVFYIISIISQLYGFCYIGECLIIESECLCHAFYNSEWYNAPPHHGKFILMCILRSQRPLALTAGNIFTFSLESFTHVRQKLFINFDSKHVLLSVIHRNSFALTGFKNINGLPISYTKLLINGSQEISGSRTCLFEI